MQPAAFFLEDDMGLAIFGFQQGRGVVSWVKGCSGNPFHRGTGIARGQLGRRGSGDGFEHSVKMTDGVKAASRGNFRDGFFRVLNQLNGFLDPDMVDILGKGDA